MIGENTGLTYKDMKPYELAEIVGFNGNNHEVKDSFGSLLFHNGEKIILVRNKNSYFYIDDDPVFLNTWYSIKIVYSPYNNLTYKDLKPGQYAKVVSSKNPNCKHEQELYGCIVKHNGTSVIIIEGVNEYQKYWIKRELKNDRY